jgi:hypothetical protein
MQMIAVIFEAWPKPEHIARVISDYGMTDRAQVPKDSRVMHDVH